MIDTQAAIPARCLHRGRPRRCEVYDQLLPMVANGYSVQGVQWPAAFGVSTPVIYYNKAHFVEAGLDPDVPPTNLEEIKADAEAIKAARPDGTPLVFRADAWWLENLVSRRGR